MYKRVLCVSERLQDCMLELPTKNQARDTRASCDSPRWPEHGPCKNDATLINVDHVPLEEVAEPVFVW